MSETMEDGDSREGDSRVGRELHTFDDFLGLKDGQIIKLKVGDEWEYAKATIKRRPEDPVRAEGEGQFAEFVLLNLEVTPEGVQGSRRLDRRSLPSESRGMILDPKEESVAHQKRFSYGRDPE